MLHCASLCCSVQPPRPPASRGKDDEPSPVTPAMPPAPVHPELPPPAPPELTTLPSDEEQVTSLASEDTALDVPIHTPSSAVVLDESRTCVAAPDQSRGLLPVRLLKLLAQYLKDRADTHPCT